MTANYLLKIIFSGKNDRYRKFIFSVILTLSKHFVTAWIMCLD